MASGTGQTTGPYTLANGITQTVSDPAKGVPSVAVQIQNATGFALTVYTSGTPYAVQPQTASTIPTAGNGGQILMVPTATNASQDGSVTLVWLLDGQEAPIPDGFLTNTVANQRTALTNVVNGFATANFTVATLGTDRAVLLVLHPVAGSPTVVWSITGTQSGIAYGSGTAGVGATYSTTLGPFPVYGNLDRTLSISIQNFGINPITYDVVMTSTSLEVSGGSSLALQTYPVGGRSAAAVPLGSTTATLILAAQPQGFANRLHLATISGNGATSIAVKFSDALTVICELHMGTQNQIALEGLLVTSDVTVQAYTAVAVNCHLRYDVIALPTIT